jgi:hypothetical protein
MLKDNLKYYWRVHVPFEIAKDGVVYLLADEAEVGISGELKFIKHSESIHEDSNVACFAAGQWTCYFAASQIDGSACCVEHWTLKNKSRGF